MMAACRSNLWLRHAVSLHASSRGALLRPMSSRGLFCDACTRAGAGKCLAGDPANCQFAVATGDEADRSAVLAEKQQIRETILRVGAACGQRPCQENGCQAWDVFACSWQYALGHCDYALCCHYEETDEETGATRVRHRRSSRSWDCRFPESCKSALSELPKTGPLFLDASGDTI